MTPFPLTLSVSVDGKSALGMNLEQSSLIQKSPELRTFALFTVLGTAGFVLLLLVGKRMVASMGRIKTSSFLGVGVHTKILHKYLRNGHFWAK